MPYPAAFIAGLINSQPMGFYQPAQLLEQAKRQDVKVLPVDVTASEYDCTLELDAANKHAIRLGLRLVKGLRKEEAARIVTARESAAFHSIEDVAHLAALPKRSIQSLALAGALRSLAEHRNIAYWNALGTERLPGMLNGAAAKEDLPRLPAPSEWEDVLKDYRQLGLSTGRHPLALLRQKLQRLGVSSRRELDAMQSGRRVTVGGLATPYSIRKLRTALFLLRWRMKPASTTSFSGPVCSRSTATRFCDRI